MTDNQPAAPIAQPASLLTSMVGELTDSIAPMPTRRTVRMRTFMPYQAYRFGMVNLKMIKMIRRSHTH